MLSTTAVLQLMCKVYRLAPKAAGVFLHENSGIQVFHSVTFKVHLLSSSSTRELSLCRYYRGTLNQSITAPNTTFPLMCHVNKKEKASLKH